MSDTAATPRKTYPPKRQKVPAFARFEGTSAWQQYPRRAREFQAFLTAKRAAAHAAGTAATPGA